MKSKEVSPVRIWPEDKKYVAKIARLTKTSQTEVLHRAIELLKRERQFQEMRETYAALSQSELATLVAESQLLDKSSGDGME